MTDVEFDHRNPPEMSAEMRAALGRAQAQCRAALRPAEPEEALTVANELSISCPPQGMSDQEAEVFWRNFLEDVEGMPLWGLQRAAYLWRQDPANRFFPSGAELRELVAVELEQFLEGLAHATTALRYEPPKQEDRYMTPERLAEIKEEMARDAERRNAARSEASKGSGL